MSFTSHTTAALQQILTDTDPDPAGMYGLMVRHYADPDAVEALCDYAKGSFPSLVALFAASKHHKNRPRSFGARTRLSPSLRRSLWHSDTQVKSLTDAMLKSATEPDLLEGLRTAHSGLPDGTPSMLVWVSRWFAAHAPLEALTDRVVVEMAWRPVGRFCPELGAGPLPAPRSRVDAAHNRTRVGWMMSRYLHNRFGTHDPSWEMFKKVYDPSQTVVETADLVVTIQRG